MAYSKTTIIGRLTADPQVKKVNGKNGEQSVANLSIACNRDFGNSVDFFDVVAWRAQAENAGKYLKKGREVLIEGRMESRSYTAKTVGGEAYERRVWELVADKIVFLGKAPESNENSSSSQHTPAYQDPTNTSFYNDDIPSDDDMPF